MRNLLINTHKPIYLFSILAFSCFSSNPPELTTSSSLYSVESGVDSTFQAYNSSINLINGQIIDMNKQIQDNVKSIKSIKDSIRTFQQIDISGDTTDKDIINSLIRIQSKLNLIEEKLFYSDSLYFNLLNDLVLIESQIEDLNQNINNITDLNIIIEDIEGKTDIDKIENYKETYDSAVEYYMNKEYEKSLEILKNLVIFDANNSLSDNSQFWIAQIFYIQKNR